MPKQIVIDIDGTEAVSSVLLALLNEFPMLADRQKILFSTLSESSGIGFFPITGAAIQSSKEDIAGRTVQQCQYPFNIIYRAAPKTEEQRIRIKEFLDSLGKWLEQLEAYPSLHSENRKIKSVARNSPAYLNAAYQDGIEDWLISANLVYENEFNK